MDDGRLRPGALIADDRDVAAHFERARRYAVLGIKPESQASQPAFYVPEYLLNAGLDVVPVPVYYPDVTTILGRPVYRKVDDIPGPVDVVVVFRRPHDIEPHVDDLIRKRPALAWFQLGIRNDIAAQRLARAGIDVVQDACVMVEHRRWRARQQGAAAG
jgi:uncharacterized protein